MSWFFLILAINFVIGFTFLWVSWGLFELRDMLIFAQKSS